MKILVTSIVDLDKSAYNRLHEFVKYLSQRHDITILSIKDYWKASQTNVKLYAQGLEDTLEKVNLEYFAQRKISPIFQEVTSAATIGRLLKRINYQTFDIHFNYNTLISGYCIAKKMRSIGVNTVYDIADNLPAMIRNSPQIPFMLRPLGKFVGNVMVAKNMKIASKVVYVTSSLSKMYPAPQSKAVIIPNGVDIDLFHTRTPSQLRKELGLDGAFVLGFVGVLREGVDFEPVFAAVKELNNDGHSTKMLIVGENGGLSKNKAMAQHYEISEKVTFTGAVPYTQVPRYHSCMDACLMPLKFSNAQPLSVLQCLASSKPVISTKPLEIPHNLVLYACDKEEYKERILQLAKNPELRQEMGSAGRKYVEENHSWADIALRLEAILEEASKKTKCRGSVVLSSTA